ncbi:MAG: orotate phosphoribosyltransferase [Acidimicrobiales bacterium]
MTPAPSPDRADLRARARKVLATKAVLRFDEPVRLASGAWSSVFVDGKAGLAHGPDLRLASAALAAMLAEAGVEFDAVGGPTLGADHIAVGLALATDRSWFFVRKEPKGRGTGRQIEGATIGPDTRVVVVEDVISTGGSLLTAIDVIAATGAPIVAAASLIDRGAVCRPALAARGIPLFTLADYHDLGLEPVAPPGPAPEAGP